MPVFLARRSAAFISGRRAANSARSPTDKNPTTGQNRISKRVKTFLLVMIQFLKTKAWTLVSSSCKSDKDVLKIGLLNGEVPDGDPFPHKLVEDPGEPFLVVIHQDTAGRIIHVYL